MSGYISEMRKLVGHRTLIQCAGSIICVDDEGRLLLGKRTDNHLWGYAGGSVEIDEKIEDCAKRELFEETGIIADEIEFFYINSGKEAHYIYPNGDEVSNVEIIYICRKYHGELKRQEEEIEELRFFHPEEISLDMISPPIRPVFEEYFKVFGRGI
ncbi:MAG: NUDIX domain-containing protein [Ruminococcus sp.]|uniref:NUDIX hydrolase n=1 Tax=Ruminococcus sp. TaxID=41978 RepID=UPI0025F4A83D|nr:NUDIX domain-containing protein [Ruminococcus sp.]MCR5540473.1 NUDIX domain-containing protein [Ruminococcus sp.]